MKLFFLFAVALLVLVFLRFYGRRVLGFEGFASSGKEVVIVKADWCGHCKKAKPEFEKLIGASPIRLSDGSEVTVRMLDEGSNKPEVQGLGVKGFPTILYLSNGQKTEYSGPRTYDGVMGFLQSSA
jgi:thiol-disulfide isomerase/thioredoxin